MRTFKMFVIPAIAIFLMAATVVSQFNSVSAAPDTGRVGLVIAYVPGQSITIVDRDGNQYMFELATPLKIVPEHRADMLAVGAYVTIIAPNNVPNGKHIATGIVVHPQPPAGFPMPTFTFTPLPTDTATALPTETMLPSETPTSTEVVTETPTETVTATPTGSETATETATSTATETVTATSTETATETATPTATPTATQTTGVNSATQIDPEKVVTSFLEWLATFFRQFLTSGS